MRRRPTTAAVYALIGAGLTLASSWCCALFSPIGEWSITYDPPTPGSRLSSVSTVPNGWVVDTHVLRSGPGLRYQLVTEMSWIGSTLGMMSDRQNRSLERIEVGWPMPAMEWIGGMDHRHPSARGAPAQGHTWLDGLQPPFAGEHLALGANRRLPVVPLWPGFAVNVAAWAGVVWAAAVTARVARRSIRRRRGLCPACGYPATPSSVCSECGEGAPTRPA